VCLRDINLKPIYDHTRGGAYVSFEILSQIPAFQIGGLHSGMIDGGTCHRLMAGSGVEFDSKSRIVRRCGVGSQNILLKSAVLPQEDVAILQPTVYSCIRVFELSYWWTLGSS
jgi:hypothetical protein